jgi:TatD DNase family protein
MVETDCPYLLPRTPKLTPNDRRYSPAFLSHIGHQLARDRGEEATVTAASTTATERVSFRLP